MSDMTRPTFSLLDEAWIPVVYSDGYMTRVSLMQIWHNLHQIREIWHDSPLIVATVHRLLMAIWYRADKTSWTNLQLKKKLIETEVVPVDVITSYLESFRARFDLFDAEYPFYQTADLICNEKMKPGPNTILRHSAITHFDKSDDDNPIPIPAAEAVLWMLEHQGYAFGGRITNSADSVIAAHLVNGLILFLRGNTLFETLVFSMPAYDNNKLLGLPESLSRDDAPAWEKPAPTQSKRLPQGWLDVLTWQSRRILLLPEWIDDQWQVRHVIVSGGYDLDNREFQDPMQFMRVTKDGPRLLKMNVDRATWRDLIPCLIAQTPEKVGGDGIGGVKKPLILEELENISEELSMCPRIQVIGIANDKSKMELWRQEVVNVPAKLFGHIHAQSIIDDALNLCRLGEQCLSGALFNMAEASLKRGGTRNVRREDISALANSLGGRVKYWGNLEALYMYHVLQRLEKLVELGNADNTPKAMSDVLSDWQSFLITYTRDVYNEVAGAVQHANSLRAFSIGESTLHALFYTQIINKGGER
jgi:CRISPR system Cascade subunit CasA